MKLSEKIIKLRKERGLSQEEFGNEINVSRQAVSKWETEEARPDVDKIIEIVKKFKVSYEYLLNDEIETEEKAKFVLENGRKRKSRKFLKLVIGGLLLYGLISGYKFIALYRFYLMANSFSEENYSMSLHLTTINATFPSELSTNTTKVGNKRLQISYDFAHLDGPKDECIPNEVEFKDTEQKICYQLRYDDEKKVYIYHDRKEDMIKEEEIEELFHDQNDIKENTLGSIPSSFKEIIFASIDPRYYFVSLRNRQIRTKSFEYDLETKIQLNQDGLIESITQKFDDGETIKWHFDYDYVPEHFKEIEDPRESGRYLIVYDEE